MNLSFVIPFYKKLDLFRMVLPHNKAFALPNTEVVLVLDEPGEETGVLDLIAQYPAIKWRVLVNDAPHEWRPPCKAINVGVRNALGDSIAILSPESILLNQTPLPWVRGFYTTGVISDRDAWTGIPTYENFPNEQRLNYGFGFLMMEKRLFESVHGFDESRIRYGGDDDDIRWRLRGVGFTQNCDFAIRVVHVHHSNECRAGRETFEPIGRPLVQPDWGKSFSRIAFDWNKP